MSYITRTNCPYYYKYELVDWASGYFKSSKNKFKKLSKRQLYKIYFRVYFDEKNSEYIF